MACSDWHGVQPRTMTAVFHFVQEVQQTKVHWVSGGGGGGGKERAEHIHHHTHALLLLQWRYNIRLENFTSDRVQLRERHWRIYGSTGTLETVKGRGVIGQVGGVQTRQCHAGGCGGDCSTTVHVSGSCCT